MATFFFDTSALVKFYVRETGSEWVTSILSPGTGHSICLSLLTPVEVASTLNRRAYLGDLPHSSVAAAVTHLRSATNTRFAMIEATDRLIDSAMEEAIRHSLRGADAFQLASALAVDEERRAMLLPALVFVCADDDLNTAARACGLAVENPNTRS